MTLQEAIRARHSVRAYTAQPLSEAHCRVLQEKIAEVNRLGRLHVQFIQNEPRAFQGPLAKYGKFRGVTNYLVRAGVKADDLDDRKKNLQLAIYWCAKEAIYKRMSLSGVDFAEQIEVERFNPRDEGEIYATFTHKDGTELEFELSYEVIENHVMVWVVG